jgi:hypothetical protein
MIPPFNEFGYLPPGIHPTTLDEIDKRFCECVLNEYGRPSRRQREDGLKGRPRVARTGGGEQTPALLPALAFGDEITQCQRTDWLSSRASSAA